MDLINNFIEYLKQEGKSQNLDYFRDNHKGRFIIVCEGERMEVILQTV